MTQAEGRLRDALKTHAAQMENIAALLEILAEWDVYADASLCAVARSFTMTTRCASRRRRRRRRAERHTGRIGWQNRG